MTAVTKKQFQEVNIETVRALAERVAAGAGGPFQVDGFHVDGMAAEVTFTLHTEAGAIEVVFENADSGRQTLVKTASFGISHQGSDEDVREAIPHLRAFVAELGAIDPGGLRLELPEHIGFRPAWMEPEFERDPLWRRDRFEENFRKLKPPHGTYEAVCVVVTQSCKMNCVFCPKSDRVGFNMHAEGATPRDLLDDVMSQLWQGASIGARVAFLAGSDVLLYPLVEDLCREAGRLGYERVVLETPGQRMADRAFAERLSRTAATELLAPIYGRDAETHDRIVDTPGAFADLVRGIDNANELGRPLFRLHTIALKSTIHLLPGLIDFVHERFGLPLRVDVMQPNRDGEFDLVAEMVRFSDARAAVEARPLHFAEFPLCVLPTEAALEMYRVRKQHRRHPMHDPRSRPLHLYDLGVADRSMHPVVRASRRRELPTPGCATCLVRDACPGTLGVYPMSYGTSELVPLLDEAAVAAALARTGEPFPESPLPAAHKLEVVADVFEPATRLAPARPPTLPLLGDADRAP